MTFRLKFLPSALKEWRKMDADLRGAFKKKLVERLAMPEVPSARLRNHPDCYKIKLRAAGWRLVYRVIGDEVVVVVIAVGRRDRIYRLLDRRATE
jgi:mRNA interferase RelE/StbE